MIDPLEVAIRYLLSQPVVTALVGTRVAAKHEYGSGWPIKAPSITVHLDGGAPDFYVPHQVVQVQVRCFAEEPQKAMEIWRTVAGLTRATGRQPVVTSQGNALLYWLLPASGPSLLYDPSVGLNTIIALLNVDVAENPL